MEPIQSDFAQMVIDQNSEQNHGNIDKNSFIAIPRPTKTKILYKASTYDEPKLKNIQNEK